MLFLSPDRSSFSKLLQKTWFIGCFIIILIFLIRLHNGFSFLIFLFGLSSTFASWPSISLILLFEFKIIKLFLKYYLLLLLVLLITIDVSGSSFIQYFWLSISILAWFVLILLIFGWLICFFWHFFYKWV